ncbi:MAG: hypothetical protein H6551_01055 [Chitinophagales bacterium]|nr:hypothetical protein [Chitinophagaceae bacterium]MCB9063712.1 hypothetical protein [Chitinophagales bacterium]
MQTLFTIVLSVACVLAVTSATKLQRQRTLKDISIDIENKDLGFVTEVEIKDLLNQENVTDNGKAPLAKLNVKKMETVLSANPWVEDAQVYIDNEQHMYASVKQRVPIVRIFDKEGGTYYLDRQMKAMPLSSKYNHYSMVVTNAPVLLNDDSAAKSMKSQILSVVSYIQKDPFWRAQVSQVVVLDNMQFEIVPVLGEQRIVLGDANKLDEKFDHLLAFYKKVLNEVGWDKYDLIDVSFDGQLVASPGLDWNMPEDKVIKRINWVNSILGQPVRQMTVTNTIVKTEPKDTATATTEQSAVVVQAVQPQPEQNQALAKAEPETPVKTQAKQTTEKPKEQPRKEKNEEPSKPEKPKYIYAGNGN